MSYSTLSWARGPRQKLPSARGGELSVLRFPPTTSTLPLAGYSLSVRSGRVSVRIEPGEYRRLKASFLERACHRSAETLEADFAGVGFQPYAPVRVQLLNIWRAVNRARQAAGFDRFQLRAVPWGRCIVPPFSS